jgi:hypothetical protein
MFRRGLVTVAAVFACACALSLGRCDPLPAELYRVRQVFVDVRFLGLRTPLAVEMRARRHAFVAEALVRRGFTVVDDPNKAHATLVADLDSVIVLDAPQGTRYHFSLTLTSTAFGVSWQTKFDTLNYWAPSQAEQQGIATGVDRLFSDWKHSAVAAGAVTNAEARGLERIPAATRRPRELAAAVSVPGYRFPWSTDLGCPNASCPFEPWWACATVDVREAAGSAGPVSWRLSKGDRFEAWASLLLTLEPGEVRVTRDIRQGSGVHQRVYRNGDTLYVLGHIANGRFAAIHRDRPVTVEVFWPLSPAGNYPVAGELIRPEVSERWIGVVQGERSGWILQSADVVPADGGPASPRCQARFFQNLSMDLSPSWWPLL